MMKYKHVFLLILLILCFKSVTSAPIQEKPKRILVIGLDTLQFSSNIFFIDELAHYNGVGVYDVVKLYNNRLMAALRDFKDKEFQFVIADSTETATVHANSVFIELENDLDEPFTGIAPAEGYGESLFQLMDKHQADYILTINEYQIYHKNPPDYISYDIKADHIIHYDLFNRSLTNIYGGRKPMTSNAVEAIFMMSHYKNYAKTVTIWLSAHEKSINNDLSVVENFKLIRDEKYINASAFSLSVAFDGPYGAIGVAYSRFIGRDIEAHAGLGFDFSGMKIAVGANYYLSDLIGPKFRPFFGISYALNTGNTFELGGSVDDYGNQLNPEDVSKFKISGDHAIHFTGGMSYWMEYSVISVSAGYSFPFKGIRPQLISGNDSKGRLNLVNALNPGGLGISVKYLIFFNQLFNSW